MATTQAKRPLPMAADLYGDIEPSPKATWSGYLPGLAIVAAGTLAAGFLSDHYGVPSATDLAAAQPGLFNRRPRA